MKQLVRLWERPSYDGRRFRYYLLYTDEQGRRRQKSLGHADFKTTHKYYLRIHDDLVDRARQATARGLCKNLLQKCCSGDCQNQQ